MRLNNEWLGLNEHSLSGNKAASVDGLFHDAGTESRGEGRLAEEKRLIIIRFDEAEWQSLNDSRRGVQSSRWHAPMTLMG